MVRALFSATGGACSSASSGSSNTTSAASAAEILESIEGGKIDIKRVCKVLEELANDSLQMVEKRISSSPSSSSTSSSSGLTALYAINLHNVIQFMRRRTIHSIVSHSFDILTARIVELLARTK